MGSVPLVGYAQGGGLFGKSEIAIVYEKFVFLIVPINISGIANINIEPTVPVHIRHAHPCRPGSGAGYAGLFRDVLKDKISLVEVEFVWTLVSRKVNID